MLPRGLPAGIFAQGLVYGALYSLSAVGIVLIYRSSRTINFAQAQLGLIGGTTTALLVAGHHWNFYLSVLLGLLIAAATGALVQITVIRRLRASARVLVAVATIGIAQALAGVVASLPSALCNPSFLGSCSPRGGFAFPVRARIEISPVVFNGADVTAVAVAVAVLGALSAVLRLTKWGQSMRAAAENRDRAVLLGLRVNVIDMAVWAVAAGLSAVTIILHIGVFGYSGLSAAPNSGEEVLLRVLAAAVIGGMESVPRTVAAALGLGLYDAGATWSSANTPLVTASLVVVIVVALLAQRRRFSRGDRDSNWSTVPRFRPLPDEARAVPALRWTLRLGGAGALALLVSAPAWLPVGRAYLLAPLIAYGIVGLSLLVLSGWSGQISLGQFGLAGLGGAVAAFLYQNHSWNALAAAGVGVAAAALAAFVVGVPALRIRGQFLAVTTLAFAVAMSEYVLPPQWFPSFVVQSFSRPTVFGHDPFGSDAGMYYLCLAVFAVVAASLGWFRRSSAGRAVVAARDNELAAEAAGLATTRIRLAAFVISGAVAGLAGVLFVMDQRGVFYGSFSANTSVLLFTMAVVGGLGSLPGVVFGVVYIWGIQFLLPARWSVAVSGLGIVAVLMFMPDGLAGLGETVRDALVSRLVPGPSSGHPGAAGATEPVGAPGPVTV